MNEKLGSDKYVVTKNIIMQIINLDPDFKPYGYGIKFNQFIFPSKCESHIRVFPFSYDGILITTRIKSSDDIMTLLLATDALKRAGVKKIELLLPYLPYARQDREMISGEPLSLKVFATLLNPQNYFAVSIYDPHSDIAAALLDNCNVITNHAYVKEVLKDREDYLIVSPDAGAYKKIFKVCQHIEYHGEIIMCNKLRDVTNGVIRSMTISHTDLQGKDCYIIDDICDGGQTFTFLAKELKNRNCGHVNLIVSHGIFSKGIDAIDGVDRIYATNSFNDAIPNPRLTQVKLTTRLL